MEWSVGAAKVGAPTIPSACLLLTQPLSSQHPAYINPLNSSNSPLRWYLYNRHFTDDETEAQREHETSPRIHSQEVIESEKF